MAEVIIMPKLGFNMDEGQLVTWCKKPGDTVKKGEPLFEINTDKTTMPVEATCDGVLLKTLIDEGETVAVFTPIAVIGAAGENPDAALAASGHGGDAPAATASAPQAAPAAPSPADMLPAGMPALFTGLPVNLKLTPKVRKMVEEGKTDLTDLAKILGTGFQGGITSRDVVAAGAASGQADAVAGSRATPLARKVAAEHGVDLAAVAGTGQAGKIMEADVRKAAQGLSAALAAAAAAAGISAGTAGLRVDGMGKIIRSVTPYAGVRKIIGDRLAQSKFTAPHLYFTDSVDTTAFTAFRRQINDAGDGKVAVSDLLVMAVAKALRLHPGMNVSLVGQEIIAYDSLNIGVAVAGDNGLIVPVLKNVQNKNLMHIARESRDLVERAKAGRLSPDEFSGGTFTISNLGMFGIENFTAIINPPEAAILAVSSVRKKAVVVANARGDDEIVIRPMMNVQLSVDHRLIDGLLAAQFVGSLKRVLENPVSILL